MIEEKTLQMILTSEGGYNPDEPASVGGESYAGITRNKYNEYRLARGDAKFDCPDDLKKLGGKSVDNEKNKYKSPYDLAKVYANIRIDIIEDFYEWYLQPYHVAELPECLQYIHADFAINAASAANKIIQQMVGVDADGVWGKGTSSAVAEYFDDFDARVEEDPDIDNDLITEYHNAKLAHYNRLATLNPDQFGKWLKGWIKRSNHVLSELQEYFVDEKPTPSAVIETEEPNLHISDVEPDEKDVAKITDAIKGDLPDILADAIKKALQKNI